MTIRSFLVVEDPLLTVVLYPMVTVVIHHVVLVSAVHDMDSTSSASVCFRDEIMKIVFSCGSVGAYCARKRSMDNTTVATLEGEFKGRATYYNETKVGSDYSTCGTERGRSLDESDEKIYTAALNQAQFDPFTVDGIPSNNPICQKKAIVKGPQGQITVRFVDRCPECQEGKLSRRKKKC